MAGGYERVWKLGVSGLSRNADKIQVNAQDEDDHVESPIRHHQPSPISPPPSFHSRASSPQRYNNHVDPTLADAFDDDGDDSDDEADDRQRLVRQNSTPSGGANDGSSSQITPEQSPAYGTPSPDTAARSGRVVGGGIATDGVFANMSARPERQETEKDEQPPVSLGYSRQRQDNHSNMPSDIRASSRRCRSPILGDNDSRAWSRRPR